MIPTQTLSEFLEEQNLPGQLQEALSDYLEGLGHTGPLPEAIYEWLKVEGYEGTINDMVKDWVAGFVPAPVQEWIASAGNGSVTISKWPEVILLNGTGGENSMTIGNA